MHALKRPLNASGLLLVLLLVAAVPLAMAGDDDSRGYLGVFLQEVGPSLAKALQMEDESGVLIHGVVEDSPAEEAGLEDGDVILEFDGRAIEDERDLRKAVRRSDPGEEVEIVVLREGEKKTIEVELGEAEDHEWSWDFGELEDFHVDLDHLKDLKHKFKSWTTNDGRHVYVLGDGDFYINEDRGHLGIHIENLGEQLGEYFGVEDGEGVLVSHVIEDGAAAAAGLQAGDIIVELDGRDVEDTNDLHKALAKTEPEDQVELKVMRQGKAKDIDVTLGEAPEHEITRTITIHGDDDEHIEIRAPRMIMRHGKHGLEFDDDELMKVYRSHGHAEDEMEALREELEKLRGELKELRDDLQR